MRNAVLGSRSAKEIVVEMSSQCYIAVKSANGALKGENWSNFHRRGNIWDRCGCVWKALQEHHSFIGKHLDKPKKDQRSWKACIKRAPRAQFLEFQRENGECLSSWVCLAGMRMGWKMGFQVRWGSSDEMKLPEVEARSKTLPGFGPFWFSNNQTLELLSLAFLLQKLDF